jgi:hypothetical protein
VTREIVARQKRKAATARAIAAAALLRESEQVEPTSAAKASYLAELAFMQLTQAAVAIEPELGDEVPDHQVTDTVN